MKTRFAMLIALLVLPATAFGHAEMFFPKLFSVTELSTSGFILLNADPAIATVNFYLLAPAGTIVSSPPAIQIPPGGQFARLGTELFTTAAAGGWVYVITDTEGMQAFWLNYDAGLTYLDGAEAVSLETIGPDQIIPLVTSDVELNVVSLNGIVVPVTVRLFGADGELAPPFTRSLAIAGAFQARVSEMFPNADLEQARYMRIRTPGAPIASTALIRKFTVPFESAVVNGVNAGSRAELIFSHVVSGALADAGYTTTIGLTNLSASAQDVTITFHSDEGEPVTATRGLAANGALRETVAGLFQLNPAFVTGWVQVSGTAPLTGFAAYADSVGGGLAVVPAGTSQTNLFFAHIANGLPKWQTGLAILNTGSTPASVEMFAVNPSGTLIGRTVFSVDPGRKIARVIHEFIPETRGVNGGYVYVRSVNGAPLHGIELFYTEDLKVLSNVAAGKLAAGVGYVPPQ